LIFPMDALAGPSWRFLAPMRTLQAMHVQAGIFLARRAIALVTVSRQCGSAPSLAIGSALKHALAMSM
jgi:hypothetical protein